MGEIYTLDLHTHALEKKGKAEEYWERAREIGLNGIASTEHADHSPKEAYLKLLEKKPEDMLLIPGIEVNSNFGHVLAYAPSGEIYEIEEILKKDIPLWRLIKIAKEEKILLSVSHPWGFSHDSIGFLYGKERLGRLIGRGGIGVEVYNGMIGHLSDFIYDSGWIKRPINFLDFLDNNRVARRTGIAKLSSRIKGRVDRERLDVLKRCARAIELGSKAAFVTAGSDSHSAERVGAGIIKISIPGSSPGNEKFLRNLREKENVIWAGPLVKEKGEGGYEKIDDPLKRKEIVQGIRYATQKVIRDVSIKERISRRIGKKALKKKIAEIKNKITQ